MADGKLTIRAPKVRLWRYLPILIILGLAVHLLLPQIADLRKSWSVIRQMTWWVVALAILVQALSYIGSGYTLQTILANSREKLSITKGVLITLASNSIGLVAGGWIGGAAATYGWVRREDQYGDAAALAGTLPPLLNNAVLAGVSAIGVIYLLVNHDLSQVQLVGFSVVLMALGALAAGIIAALYHPGATTRLAIRLAGRWAKFRRREYQPQDTEASVNQFVQAWRAMGHGRWLHPALGAVANVGFDMLTLYFMFVAAGHPVSPGVLFAGYGLPYMLGKIAFMFPGGVGVVETGMIAIYGSLGVPSDISVVVILGYRLISFWVPSLLGFSAAAYLGSKKKRAEAPA